MEDRERDVSLLASAMKNGRLGMSQKMKSTRQQSYVLPSGITDDTGFDSEAAQQQSYILSPGSSDTGFDSEADRQQSYVLSPGTSDTGVNSEAAKQQSYILPSVTSDTGVNSQGSSWTFGSIGTGTWTMATLEANFSSDSAYLEAIIRGDDLNYVKQKYGRMSILFSTIQLFFLTMVISACGFAPITINPAIGPYPDVLSTVGGTNSYLILRQGQLWRFFTSPLMSAGILHFLCVAGIQVELGAFFERDWGSRSWLIIFIASAIGSAMCDCVFNSDGVSAGSTGPLVGLLGAKISEIILFMCFKTKDAYLIDGVNQLLAILFTLFFISLLLCFPYVSWGAHLGGFFAGFITGMLVFTSKLKYGRDKKCWLSVAMVLGLSLIAAFFLYLIGSNPSANLADVCEYYENIHPDNYDCHCGL